MTRAERDAELEPLLLAFQRGDESALERVFIIMRPVTRNIANGYWLIPGSEPEDKWQHCEIAMWRGAKIYDPEKGKPTSFLATCCHRTLITLLKQSSSLHARVLNHAVSCDIHAPQAGQWDASRHWVAEQNNFAERPELSTGPRDKERAALDEEFDGYREALKKIDLSVNEKLVLENYTTDSESGHERTYSATAEALNRLNPQGEGVIKHWDMRTVDNALLRVKLKLLTQGVTVEKRGYKNADKTTRP